MLIDRSRSVSAISLDRLTEAQLEELVLRLLVKGAGTEPQYVARIRGAGGATVSIWDIASSGRWAIECRTGSKALRAAILQLPSYQRIHDATHALLVTTAAVPDSLRQEVANPLDVEVWDQKTLRAMLKHRPAIARAYARTARSSEGHTRLRTLTLQNFRGIRDMQLDFGDRPVTLLVGLN
ncbi:MAG TPA: ATP-binding protein, partial [Haliangium sp.]|nr:ATP-binding protein [Haliangium sp.]